MHEAVFASPACSGFDRPSPFTPGCSCRFASQNIEGLSADQGDSLTQTRPKASLFLLFRCQIAVGIAVHEKLQPPITPRRQPECRHGLNHFKGGFFRPSSWVMPPSVVAIESRRV